MVCVWNVWTDDKLLFGLNFPWAMIEFDRLSNPWGPFPSFSDLSHMVIYFLATLLEFIWFFTTAGGSESHSIHCPTKTAVWDCDIGTGHPDVPATTLLNGTWLTQERPCWSVYFAEFFARFSQSEPFQSTFRTSMRFSYFLLLLDFANHYSSKVFRLLRPPGLLYTLKLGLLRVTGIQFPLDPFMDPFPI